MQQVSNTDSATVQTAQGYRQRNGTDSAMVQTGHRSCGSRCAHSLCLGFICRGSKADLEHDVQGVWILYFHCYNGTTVLQLGLVHLQDTYGLLGLQHMYIQTTITTLVMVLQKLCHVVFADELVS